jgi:hypothetical protein
MMSTLKAHLAGPDSPEYRHYLSVRDKVLRIFFGPLPVPQV